MRPTTHAQSALLQPLSHALATESRVRVLRVLASGSHPVGVPGLAEATALNERGVRTVLRHLEELGAVTVVPGAGQQVILRERWPLAKAVRDLFAAETQHAHAVSRALRKAAQSITPPPIGVWIAGPHAAGIDRPTDPLLIVCYGAPRGGPVQASQLTRALADLSARLDLPAPEVRLVTKAEVELAMEASASGGPPHDERFRPPLRLLAGALPPLPWLARPARAARTHADYDDMAAIRADVIAGLLRRSPDLAERARSALETRRATASERVRGALDEWAVLLDTQPPARLASLLRRDDERMTRLRQTLPFLEALTPTERAEVDAAVAARNAAVHG